MDAAFRRAPEPEKHTAAQSLTTTTMTTTTTYEQKGGNNSKSCRGGKREGGEEVQLCRFVELRLGRIFLSEVVGSCFLLLRKMLSGQNHREGAALTTGRCDVAPNSTLSDSQPASRAAGAHHRSRHQPLVLIIFISPKTPEGSQ